MRVFKFGGASVKDAAAVVNVASILSQYSNENIFIVVSAMGKTTNALEQYVEALYAESEQAPTLLDMVKQQHIQIVDQLFDQETHKVYDDIHNIFVELEWISEEVLSHTYDYAYDQIVSAGELLSSKILSHYLTSFGLGNQWVDVRDFIRTDNSYREGLVDWELSAQLFQHHIASYFTAPNKLCVTQGFIGGTSENYTTTLGREGSDYTASIIAYLGNAKDVTIWKDVSGVLSADPKKFSDAVLIPKLSYYDAVELTYYGATVIHPKTIKPLQNNSIPLFVKSFLHPFADGTVIDQNEHPIDTPCFIHKPNQLLISISVKDFSFIAEKHLSHIYALMANQRVKVNMMQNSALSFSACVDEHPHAFRLIDELQKDYFIRYNTSLCLYTIKHYNTDAIKRIAEGKQVILEQRSRNTIQLVVKS